MNTALTLLSALLLSSLAACSGEPFSIGGLQCEMRVNPVGVDVERPRFRWIMEAELRGQRQTAYQLLVTTDKAALEQGVGDCWDSGQIPSDQSVAVVYAGKPLTSGRQYWWKVRPYGRIISNWKREGDTVSLEITIPPNTTATVFVPAKDMASVLDGGNATDKARDVRFLRMQDGAAVYAVGSGCHQFSTSRKEAP